MQGTWEAGEMDRSQRFTISPFLSACRMTVEVTFCLGCTIMPWLKMRPRKIAHRAPEVLIKSLMKADPGNKLKPEILISLMKLSCWL
jgi:hypothetical protein